MYDLQGIAAYLKKVSTEKELFKKYALIQNGKMPSEDLNCSIIPKLSKKAIEYGFMPKLVNMICSLDITNENIIIANDIWAMLQVNSDKTNIYHMYYWTKMNQSCAHIVYDIRHFVDQIIAMAWILTQTESFEEVKVDSIGLYLNDSTFSLFDKHNSFLRQLNNISNAYKHSISNDMATLLGRDEPCIFALDGNHNKNIFKPQMYGISLRELVISFNSFYKDSLRILENINN